MSDARYDIGSPRYQLTETNYRKRRVELDCGGLGPELRLTKTFRYAGGAVLLCGHAPRPAVAMTTGGDAYSQPKPPISKVGSHSRVDRGPDLASRLMKVWRA